MWDLKTINKMNEEKKSAISIKDDDDPVGFRMQGWDRSDVNKAYLFITECDDAEFFVFFNRVVSEFMKRSGIYARDNS